MGSWGPGTFEDDIACDWLEDLQDSDPMAFFAHCLDLRGHRYLEFLACAGVVCTAEMIHSLICQPRSGLPEAAHRWLDENQGLDVIQFIPASISGLRRVMGPNSEMYELWEDSDDLHEVWLATIDDLLKRLEAALAGIR